jgi:hypothetical protein
MTIVAGKFWSDGKKFEHFAESATLDPQIGE